MRNLYIVFIVFSFCSCVNKNMFRVYSTKDGATQLSLSEISSDVIKIPLETSEHCLLRPDIDVQMDGDKLFIHSDNELFLFSKNGGFVKKLTQKGNGPGEVTVLNFNVFKKDKKLLVQGYDNSINVYDYNGSFFNNVNIPADSFGVITSISSYGADIWIRTVKRTDRETEEWFCKLDPELNLTNRLLIHKYESTSYIGGYPGNELSICGSLYIHYPSLKTDREFRDTVYTVESSFKTITPSFKIDYGELTYKEADPSKFLDIEAGYPVILHPVRVSARYIISSYNSFSDFKGIFVYDRKNEKGYNAIGGIEDDIFNTGKIFTIKFPEPDNSFFIYSGNEDGDVENINDNNPTVYIACLNN